MFVRTHFFNQWVHTRGAKEEEQRTLLKTGRREEIKAGSEIERRSLSICEKQEMQTRNDENTFMMFFTSLFT